MYKLDIEAEFFNFVFIQDDGHWLWTGTYDEEYPRFKQEYAYRWAYKHFIGPIPERYDIDHLCEQTWCVNPICLEAVTPVVNRERQAAKQRREKTHCPSGHPYFGDNLYLWHNTRMCRECQRQRYTIRNAMVSAQRRERRERKVLIDQS